MLNQQIFRLKQIGFQFMVEKIYMKFGLKGCAKQDSDNFDINQLSIDGQLQSTDTDDYHCQINLNFNIQKIYDYNFINNLIFCSIATLILIIQFMSTTKLIQQINNNKQKHFKQTIQLSDFQLSLLASQFSVIQGRIQLFILLRALIQNFKYEYFYIIPSFLQLVLCSSKDPQFVNLIWLQRYMLADIERRARIKQFMYFVVILNFFIILNLVLENLFWNSFYFMLSQSFVLYPQVIRNVRLKLNNNFNKLYIFGFLSSKLYFYPYVRSCPVNISFMETDYIFVGVFLFVYALSLFLITIQQKYGSRCFIPKFLFPKPFSYFQKVIVHDSMECPICLNSLKLRPEDMDVRPMNQLLQHQIMVTPCKHEFHPQCLQQWLKIQNRCPLCRGHLPPFVEDDR
ncbi:unnamed protein product [Paramecium sonneborni]|uniref:RING-type E3 ubiquitin transferase n=1 Tax=Paramecium sonneborni TaxID=65129 RepID=A0A8S1K0D4_9CILI|nr:unnamed protein product [Paramecium sonneborni]